MKLQGFVGKGSGKLGASVFTIRKGVQIVRQYNDKVYNPQTKSQSDQRAKFKLMSQLAAVMSPVVAIPSVGNVSSRNRFMAENIKLASFVDNQATITLVDVQLTKSVLALPGISATRGTNNISVTLTGVPQGIARVVYAVFVKEADEKLRLAGTKTVSGAGSQTFSTTIDVSSSNELVVYAYGVRDNTDAARAVFSNMQVVTAEDVAKLIVGRVLTEVDVTLTETVAAVVAPVQP